jgi:hypothetical protein
MWLARVLMLLVATLLLLLALAFITVLMFASLVRWLLTGKKPKPILFAQAIQRWKHMASQAACAQNIQHNVIDEEVREVTEGKNRLR